MPHWNCASEYISLLYRSLKNCESLFSKELAKIALCLWATSDLVGRRSLHHYDPLSPAQAWLLWHDSNLPRTDSHNANRKIRFNCLEPKCSVKRVFYSFGNNIRTGAKMSQWPKWWKKKTCRPKNCISVFFVTRKVHSFQVTLHELETSVHNVISKRIIMFVFRDIETQGFPVGSLKPKQDNLAIIISMSQEFV